MYWFKPLTAGSVDERSDGSDVGIPNFELPNDDQERATRAALGGTFTMIQGPPGAFTITSGYVNCFTSVYSLIIRYIAFG